MDLYTNLTAPLLAFLLLAAVAAVVSVGLIAGLVVSNHRQRVARHESIRTYYRRQFALTH